MDYDIFKGCIYRAGLHINQFADLLDMNHRSLSNYSKGGVVPDHLALIALLLVELERCGGDASKVFANLAKGRGGRPKQRGGKFRGVQRQ